MVYGSPSLILQTEIDLECLCYLKSGETGKRLKYGSAGRNKLHLADLKAASLSCPPRPAGTRSRTALLQQGGTQGHPFQKPKEATWLRQQIRQWRLVQMGPTMVFPWPAATCLLPFFSNQALLASFLLLRLNDAFLEHGRKMEEEGNGIGMALLCLHLIFDTLPPTLPMGTSHH